MLILLNLINIFVSLYFRKNNIQQIKQDHHHKHHLPWSFSIRLLLNQSYHWSYWNRMAISMKFILITWSFAILILNQHYVSFLFAFISLSPTIPAIDSIEKLEKECLKKNVEIFADSGSFMSSALKRTKDPIMKNIHRCLTAISNERGIIPPQMLYDDYTSNYNELNQQKQEHQKVMKRRSKKRWKQYVYINSKSRLTYALLILGPGSIYIPALNDDFRTTLLLTHIAIPTSPSFRPYRHSFERVIKIIRSSGILMYLINKEITEARLYNRTMIKFQFVEQNKKFDKLNIENLANIFFIFSIGNLLSILIFIGEIFIGKILIIINRNKLMNKIYPIR